MPGRHSDVHSGFSFDVLSDGNTEKSLPLRGEMLEASGVAWRYVCAHLTLPESHMLASPGAESDKGLPVLMRLPGGRMLTNSPGELLP
jgi:hypothetical protein